MATSHTLIKLGPSVTSFLWTEIAFWDKEHNWFLMQLKIVELQSINQLAGEEQRILLEENGILYFNAFLFGEWNCRRLYHTLARSLLISYYVFGEIGAKLWRENLVIWTNFCGFRDQNSLGFWDQGSIFWVKIWDRLWKNITRYNRAIFLNM